MPSHHHNALSLATRLIEPLPQGSAGLFNPWRDRCPFDSGNHGPTARLERLARHLDCEPRYILVGEAPGYQGCRYSGIAFTSERLLLEEVIPRIPPLTERLSTRRIPFSEPSATIVWRTLRSLGIAEHTILWNALQLHPHLTENPWTNRTPTPRELSLGANSLLLLLAEFPSASPVAIGKKAELLMRSQGIAPLATVRHPANGGATAFATGMAALV